MENLDKKLLGKLIRLRRMEMDITTDEFAFKIGIDSNTLNRIERGVHLPESNTLYKINQNTGISIDRLFNEHSKLANENKGD
ncbi:hypothetical protein BC6307_07150 [Sutcliffiella cohnii]|uniref:HTH cro/C1-type domain-containing protein n=1 Tax=Sutcliffiella cohnii TaxID=33932 RepID=A0A223KNP2_9BACI|nr:helix-turn-helix transcriptional regulator [Sutcliffiella cohnii]AST91069.1 hypothetical protein BC6307_07150 [Sutcliffiella cohnii]